MREIRIWKMRMENFKCHGQLELVLEGKSANILGDNGSGKTSVFDAFVWLLFGTDSLGNGEKNAQVKPLDGEGQVRDHAGITAVEAQLDVDGEAIKLRREYHEVWRSGCYEGNASAYFIDGVGVRFTAFRARVQEMVDEEVFRMLADVYYFASQLPWQRRREVLGLVAKLPQDRELLADARFAPLVQGMGRGSLEGYRARLLAQKKGYLVTGKELPARLDECRKTIADLEALDFAGVREQLEVLRRQREDTARELTEVRGESRAQEAAELERRAESTRRQEEAMAQSLMRMQRRLADCRERQETAKQRVFSVVCPTCGQMLAGEKLCAAREKFAARQDSELRGLEQELQGLEQAQQQTQETLAQLEAVGREEAQRLEELRQQMRGEKTVESQAQLRSRLEGLDCRMEQLRAVAAKEATLDYARQRMQTLRREAELAEAALEQVEALLALVEEFYRYKVSFLEGSVNRAFRIANFRLFREQVDGGLEERCDVTYHGVPWLGLNSGAKINVGIDIRNTLSRVFGVNVPLFVDNAESVTRMEWANGQVIRLVVSAGDKVIRKEVF